MAKIRDRGRIDRTLLLRSYYTHNRRALDQRADNYITHPFDIERLFARIRSGLRHRLQLQP
jgi:DNA-binding response OmpR family regulator